MEQSSPHGQYLTHMEILTKYDCSFDEETLKINFKRLTNQIWKLIPMRENDEDWKKQLSNIMLEIAGLQSLFNNQLDFLMLLSKLEGLIVQEDIPFTQYRKIVFNSIELLNKVI